MKRRKLLKLLLKTQKSEIKALHTVIKRLIMVNESFSGDSGGDDGPAPDLTLSVKAKDPIQPGSVAASDYHQ